MKAERRATTGKNSDSFCNVKIYVLRLAGGSLEQTIFVAKDVTDAYAKKVTSSPKFAFGEGKESLKGPLFTSIYTLGAK